MSSNISRLGLIVGLSLGVSIAAHARTETIRWTQNEMSRVAGFVLYWGDVSGLHPNPVNVGLPTADSNGVFSHDLELPDSTVYLVARSYDDDGFMSDPSNEKQIAAVSSEPPPGSETPSPTPTEGALVREDFEGAALGTVIPSWMDTASKNSMVEDDSLFAVGDLAGNQVMTTSSELLNIHSHYVATGAHDLADYELHGRMRIGDPTGSVGVTAYSRYPQEDVYYKLFRIGTDAAADFWLVGHPSFGCTPNRTGVTPAADTWYEFRLQVTTGASANDIRARVWRQGDAEPTSWQIDCADTTATRPLSGTFGVWSRGPGAKYWDDLEVIAVSASDPPPDGGSTTDPPPDGGSTTDPPPDDGSTTDPPPDSSLGQPGQPVLIP